MSKSLANLVKKRRPRGGQRTELVGEHVRFAQNKDPKELQFWRGMDVDDAVIRLWEKQAGIEKGASIRISSGGKCEKKYLIHPANERKVRWDMIVGVLIVWTVFVSPYRIGFDVAMEEFLWLDWLVDVTFWIDIVARYGFRDQHPSD